MTKLERMILAGIAAFMIPDEDGVSGLRLTLGLVVFIIIFGTVGGIERGLIWP